VYCIYLKNNVKAGTKNHSTSVYKLRKMSFFLRVNSIGSGNGMFDVLYAVITESLVTTTRENGKCENFPI